MIAHLPTYTTINLGPELISCIDGLFSVKDQRVTISGSGALALVTTTSDTVAVWKQP